jgi:hypothetical protein
VGGIDVHAFEAAGDWRHCSARSFSSLGRQAALQAAKIDNHSLMCAGPNLFGLIARGHLELNASAIDFDDLGFSHDLLSNRRSGEMLDIDLGANRASLASR